jgi:NTP pyrophosphatase (non-canonical NTP hydrolase)
MTNRFSIGDRVKTTQAAGFHKGAEGVITYIEPSGKCWVRRDNSGSDVWYSADELALIPTKKTRKRGDVMDVLQEECAEVIQAVSKIRRFGLNESWEGVTNKDALITEIGDVIAVIGILMDETDINITDADIIKAVAAKKKKLDIFLPYE